MDVWSTSVMLDKLQNRAWLSLIGGITISLLGFLMPWFKFSEKANWWYSGPQIIFHEGLPWIAFIFILYAILFILTIIPLGQSTKVEVWTALLALLTVLATSTLVMLALADAAGDSVRQMTRLVWGPGLIFMLLGDTLMVWGAFSRWVINVLSLLISKELFPTSS